MNKNELYEKLKNINITRGTFLNYLRDLKNFKQYCINNSYSNIINFQKRNKKYKNFIANLVIGGNSNILYILIKNNKDNYYIASIDNNNICDFNKVKIKGYDNYYCKHVDKIISGERIADINVVLQYIDYRYIKNIYYERDTNNKHYGQNKFIMYIPFLETKKYKCSCVKSDCYCKDAKYKYLVPINIYKQNNDYIIDIMTIYRIKNENKYPINI